MPSASRRVWTGVARRGPRGAAGRWMTTQSPLSSAVSATGLITSCARNAPGEGIGVTVTGHTLCSADSRPGASSLDQPCVSLLPGLGALPSLPATPLKMRMPNPFGSPQLWATSQWEQLNSLN